MSPTFAERIAILEERAAECARTREDVENRLRRIERNMYLATGALAVLQVILKFIA